jgi:poly-gamma-glutamate capsule biosynthesis protein CapA/YwtB (metallophosphatase superfamily)
LGEGQEAPARNACDLEALPPVALRVIARRFLAHPLPFAEAPLGVSEAEAAAGGLVELSSIEPPLRAAPIDGLLPGQAGYPFAERVELSVEGDAPAALSAWLAALPEPAAGPALLGAVGDMIVHRSFQPAIEKPGAGPELYFGDTLATLRSFDYLIGNLEGPVSLRGTGNPIKKYQFRHTPAVLKAFADAGLDHAAFANNHTLDFGLDAFYDTLDAIDALGLGRSGAGRDLAEASSPYELTLKGQELSIFAIARYPVESRGYSPAHAAAGPDSPGILTDPALLRQRIREAAARGRFVIVIAHAGHEYVPRPIPEIKTLYRSFVDAGAKLVLGGHPHVLQGMESYKGSTIAYSLGNFIFIGLNEEPPAQRSGIFSFVIDGGVVRGYNFIPVTAGNERTMLDPGIKAAEAYFMGLVKGLKE